MRYYILVSVHGLPLAWGAFFNDAIKVVTAFNTDAISAKRGLKVNIHIRITKTKTRERKNDVSELHVIKFYLSKINGSYI